MKPFSLQFLRATSRCVPLICWALFSAGLARGQEPPNVLLIILDDSNDWIGVLNEHPQTRTPRMDALAAEGILFTSAHAAAALCNPSRTSLLTGISPGRSGVRINTDQPWREFLPEAVSLNQAFREAGYYTVGLSKIFHGNTKNSDLANWDTYTPKPISATPPAAAIPINGFDGITRGGAGGGDWGVVNAPASAIEDHIVATWAEEFFANRNPADVRPFFLAVGFRSTHSPWYFPRSYFDRIAGGNTSSIVLPQTMSGDLDDVGPVGRLFAAEQVWAPLVRDPAAVRWAVHSYLAGIRFMDEQVGRVLDALSAAGHADDTIVVLVSDHGYHLSEKQTWQKQKLWEEDTRVPMMFRIPPAFLPAPVAEVDRPVSISAIYPTLLELAGIPLPAYADDDPLYHIDYRSLVPLLQGNAPNWTDVAVTYGPQDELSLRLPDRRFTLYRDGFRELYERSADPNEWYNVATAARNAEQVRILTSDAERYLAGAHAPFGLPDTCGTPDLDHDSQAGMYAWRECSIGAQQAWRIRVTGGDRGEAKRYAGHVAASAVATGITRVGLEPEDTLSQNLDFNISVAMLDTEGFNFSVPNGADACLRFDAIPTGAALHIGGTRFHLSAPVNLRTLESCGVVVHPGSIGDYVWLDTDRDGAQDASESGLGSIGIHLINCDNGAEVATTASDAAGMFMFDGVHAGRFRLRFVAPAGFAFSPKNPAAGGGNDSDADAAGLTACTALAEGQSRLGIDAGLYSVTGNTPVPVVDWNAPTGGVSISSNLVRYTGSPTGWIQNLASSKALSSLGLGSSFEVRWRIEGTPATSIWTVGLGFQGTLGGWRDIELGMRNSGGLLQIYESGTWRSDGPALKDGDVIALHVHPGYLEYRHNGQIVYTSTYSGTPAFYANASFLSGPIAFRVTALRVPP